MIENYALSSKGLYQILKAKNVEYLYHANTVLTAKTFIQQRCLLSRHQVESDKLLQSPQKSDPEDKKYDVWDAIFLDGADLHVKYSQPNFYGPVLFKIKLDMLISPSFEKVYVTKSNPMYWSDHTKIEDKYYGTLDQFKVDYLTTTKLDSQIMFTFRTPLRELKLNKFLHSIEIDEPKILLKLKSGGEMEAGKYVRSAIEEEMAKYGLSHIPLETKQHNLLSKCSCAFGYTYLYNTNYLEFKRRFTRQPEN